MPDLDMELLRPKKVDKTKSESVKEVPWVEKYRPKTVDEVVYQEEVVNVLKRCLNGADIPNMLFYGPPGTGKTSTILALCREMFGDLFRERVLELNASDERGIDVIRERVKHFSMQTSVGRTNKAGKKVPQLKIVVLDECDSMTGAAQAALRRIMEKESKTTRFCLICNYVTRIIEPIASRCTKFRFKPLRNDLIEGKLAEICEKERIVTQSAEVLPELIKVSEGDLRKAITMLHTLSRLNLNVDDEENGVFSSRVDTESVHEVAGVIPDDLIKQSIKIARKADVQKMRDYVEELVYSGYPASQYLLQLHDMVLLNEKLGLDCNQKAKVCTLIAEADHQLLEGASEFLQLLHVGISLIEIFNVKK